MSSNTLEIRIGAWLLMAMLHFVIEGNSQQTFNLRYFQLLQSSAQSVHLTSNGYLLVGFTMDTTHSSFHSDLSTRYIALDGSINNQEHFGDVGSELITTGNSVSSSLELFVQTSLIFLQDTLFCNLAFLNDIGDSLFTSNIVSPYILDEGNYNDYILPKFSYLSSDGSVYFTASIGNETTFNDAVLYKLDAQGHELWHYVHATLSDPDAIYAVVPHQGGVIYTL